MLLSPQQLYNCCTTLRQPHGNRAQDFMRRGYACLTTTYQPIQEVMGVACLPSYTSVIVGRTW